MLLVPTLRRKTVNLLKKTVTRYANCI